MKKTRIKKITSLAVAGAMLLCGLPQVGASSAWAASADKAPVFRQAENGGGSYTDAYQNVIPTKDGGFLVSGYTFGDSSSPKWTFAGKHTNNDAVLVKYDKHDQIEWSKAYGTTGVEVIEAVDELKDGTIAAAGREAYTSKDSTIKGVSWKIMLLDPKDGSILQTIRIGGASGDQAYGLAATADGGFVVGGWSASKAGYIVRDDEETSQQLWEAAGGKDEQIPNRLASGGSDSVVVKLDADGTVQFCALHNYEVIEDAFSITNPSERLESLTVDEDGDILLVGYGAVAKNAQNAVIAKLSGKDGSLLWHRSAGRADMKTVPNDAADYIKAEYKDIAVLTDGSIVTVGSADNDATTEEGWQTTAAKDTILVRYDANGNLLHTESFGRINDANSRPEGIAATPDGGYILCGSQSGVMYEDDLIARGYDFGNYGAQDAILIKYDKSDALCWAENYGTTGGDWINGITVSDDGEVIAVGESNGSYGVPSYGNNGGIDGIVMISGSSDEDSETAGIVSDGDVSWADGVYTGIGNGYGGDMQIEIVVEGGAISYVNCIADKETDEFYYDASALFDQIVEKQTADLDAVSGATLSSNGILEGATKALSGAAAAHVDQLIEAIQKAEEGAAREAAIREAAAAWEQLGTYAREALKNEAALQEAAASIGLTLTAKSDVAQLKEMLPEPAGQLAHTDRYYKIQNVYYSNVRAEGLRDHGYTGEGVRIAVLDSGITGSHKDLDYANILDGWDYGDGKTYDAETNPGSEMTAEQFYDNNGHGTAVTGILQATSDNEIGTAGLLSNAQIVPLRVIPVNGKNEAQNISSSNQVAQAIRDAVDKYQVDVITTSLDAADTDALREAVAYASENNVIIVGASGNSSSADSSGSDPYIYPASYDEVISVGAVDKNNRVRTNSQKNDQVFVAAPGENVALLDLSRNARCKISSGTSYASPVVAAMAAAAKQRMADMSGHKEDLTADMFKELLKASSVDAGAEGYDTSYGWGVVDLEGFAQRLDEGAELADAAVSSVSEDLDLLDQKLSAAREALQAAQAAADALSEDASEDDKAAAADALLQAQNAVADLENEITAKREKLNAALKQAYPSINEEIEDLNQQLEDLNDQLKQAQVIDISYYAVTLNAEAFPYTGKPIKPAVSVPGLDFSKGDYTVSYSNNVKIGTATVTVAANEANSYKGTITKTFAITKKANSMKATSKKVTLKYSKVKKKAQKVKASKAFSVSKATGKVTYKKVSGNKKISVARSGKITVKKGLKKGTYKIKVRIRAAGSSTCQPAAKTVTLKIRIK